MDQLQLLKDLQNVVDKLDNDTDGLADLLIVSTLIGEALLSGILFREYELFRNFNEDTSSTVCETTEFNRSVAQVLESACCLEDAFARKIEAAFKLKRLAAESEDPAPAPIDPIP